MDFEVQQALIARARRARAEAVSAVVVAAAKALWTRWRKLQRAWVAVRTGIAPHR